MTEEAAIKLLELTENEDGSADIVLSLSSEYVQFFLERGILSVCKEKAKELSHEV